MTSKAGQHEKALKELKKGKSKSSKLQKIKKTIEEKPSVSQEKSKKVKPPPPKAVRWGMAAHIRNETLIRDFFTSIIDKDEEQVQSLLLEFRKIKPFSSQRNSQVEYAVEILPMTYLQDFAKHFTDQDLYSFIDSFRSYTNNPEVEKAIQKLAKRKEKLEKIEKDQDKGDETEEEVEEMKSADDIPLFKPKEGRSVIEVSYVSQEDSEFATSRRELFDEEQPMFDIPSKIQTRNINMACYKLFKDTPWLGGPSELYVSPVDENLEEYIDQSADSIVQNKVVWYKANINLYYLLCKNRGQQFQNDDIFTAWKSRNVSIKMKLAYLQKNKKLIIQDNKVFERLNKYSQRGINKLNDSANKIKNSSKVSPELRNYCIEKLNETLKKINSQYPHEYSEDFVDTLLQTENITTYQFLMKYMHIYVALHDIQFDTFYKNILDMVYPADELVYLPNETIVQELYNIDDVELAEAKHIQKIEDYITIFLQDFVKFEEGKGDLSLVPAYLVEFLQEKITPKLQNFVISNLSKTLQSISYRTEYAVEDTGNQSSQLKNSQYMQRVKSIMQSMGDRVETWISIYSRIYVLIINPHLENIREKILSGDLSPKQLVDLQIDSSSKSDINITIQKQIDEYKLIEADKLYRIKYSTKSIPTMSTSPVGGTDTIWEKDCVNRNSVKHVPYERLLYYDDPDKEVGTICLSVGNLLRDINEKRMLLNPVTGEPLSPEFGEKFKRMYKFEIEEYSKETQPLAPGLFDIIAKSIELCKEEIKKAGSNKKVCLSFENPPDITEDDYPSETDSDLLSLFDSDYGDEDEDLEGRTKSDEESDEESEPNEEPSKESESDSDSDTEPLMESDSDSDSGSTHSKSAKFNSKKDKIKCHICPSTCAQTSIKTIKKGNSDEYNIVHYCSTDCVETDDYPKESSRSGGRNGTKERQDRDS